MKNINCRLVFYYKGYFNMFGNSVIGYLNVLNNRNLFDKKKRGGGVMYSFNSIVVIFYFKFFL